MKKTLYVISNEKIFESDNNFFCDNLDMRSTPEGLSKYFEIKIISRKSKINRSQKINLKSIKNFSNIISYLFEVVKNCKNKNSKFLLISLSPYTFFSGLLIRMFGNKPFLYLRSNGYEEYKIILGSLGRFIYHLMFVSIAKVSTLISCRDHILMGKNGHLVNPSQLDNFWKEDFHPPKTDAIRLIYIGRLRKEKGIFSLIDMVKNQKEIKLTVVGASEDEDKTINYQNIDIVKIVSEKRKLIEFYDQNNITILPSYTEGYPMVVLESLSRQRPVIIFGEIKHIISNRKGIFVADRNLESLLKTINYIMDNYQSIQLSIKSNKLPDNEEFINQMQKIILTN